MNWITIDASTEASEISGAGCFVKFSEKHVVFAPNVAIRTDDKGKSKLVASPGCLTQIMFTSSGETSTTSQHWIGNKLAELERKKHRGKAVVDPKKVARMWHDWVGKDKLAEIGAKVEKQHRGKAIIDPKKVAALGKKK